MALRVRVVGKTPEAEGIARFELAACDDGGLPAFEAGAHIDVFGPSGHLRQYSLCNCPSERDRYEIAVLREAAGAGASAAMHDSVEEGDILEISAPRNHFRLVEDAPLSLLIAGGIGITPLLAMAQRLHTLRRRFLLHYATRSISRAAFAERLRTAPFAGSVRFHHDDGAAEQKMDLTQALKRPQQDAHAYICGPKGFLDAARVAAADLGWRDAHVHFEYFAGAPTYMPDDRGFEVIVNSTGQVIRVKAAQTVTQALGAHGVHITTSCEQGVCGTCLTRVLDGEIDHMDLYLTSEEQLANDQFLPCCSRAKSARLVLDL